MITGLIISTDVAIPNATIDNAEVIDILAIPHTEHKLLRSIHRHRAKLGALPNAENP